MTIFDYLGINGNLRRDHAENICFDLYGEEEKNAGYEKLFQALHMDRKFDIERYLESESYKGTYVIPGDLFAEWHRYSISVAEDEKLKSGFQRPYYWMRGKPLTWEQANDIIQKTHVWEAWDTDPFLAYPDSEGETISLDDMVIGWFVYLQAFPYLDMSIMLTTSHPAIWQWRKRRMKRNVPREDSVFAGIHIYDRRIEILAKEDALCCYRHYETLYGEE